MVAPVQLIHFLVFCGFYLLKSESAVAIFKAIARDHERDPEYLIFQLFDHGKWKILFIRFPVVIYDPELYFIATLEAVIVESYLKTLVTS